MKRTTRSGLTITRAPFWLRWCYYYNGEHMPEGFPVIYYHRPNDKATPLSDREAVDWWHRGAELANYETEEMLDIAREALTR